MLLKKQALSFKQHCKESIFNTGSDSQCAVFTLQIIQHWGECLTTEISAGHKAQMTLSKVNSHLETFPSDTQSGSNSLILTKPSSIQPPV